MRTFIQDDPDEKKVMIEEATRDWFTSQEFPRVALLSGSDQTWQAQRFVCLSPIALEFRAIEIPSPTNLAAFPHCQIS